ncbi:hypothetical protein K4F52_007473 [Lecanicillium sp. MT-2017a]|nr:hypothetical protein K4F52_007473 [Lecanicillium sp. MT-2017a]
MGAAFSRTEAGFAPLLAGEVHFTSVFEESIFTTVPAGIAVIAALLRVLSIRGEKQVVDFGSLLWGKVALGVTHTAACLACVVLWAVLPAAQADLTLPAAIFAAGGSLSLVLLLFIEHEISKRHLIRDEALRINLGSEPASGFWNRSMFVWINSTLLLGFRQALKVEDLPALDPDFKSKTVFAAFKHQWDKVTTIGSGIVSKKMARARTLWNEKIEERVAQTSNIVTQMKIIKMAGLSEPVAGFLQRLRINEVQTSMTERKFRTGITFFGKAKQSILKRR